VVENCATVSTGDREQRTADNRSCADTLVEPTPAPSRSPRKPERAEEPEAIADEGPEPTPATGKAAADRNDVPPPAHHTTPELPLTGTSVWMLGLGVAVLLAIGLLVRHFSRRDKSGQEG
jgi:LPXTG-motif cell wall-anchored protein